MDAQHPSAQAVAIAGEHIAAIGRNSDILPLASAGTRVIDARGQLVLPGFNDAHVHFLSGGFQLTNINLRDAATPEEFARRLGEFAETLPAGRWMTGGEWDHERWPDAILPTRELINALTPDTPVFVSRLDAHMALANSQALKLAGMRRDVQTPPGGMIVRGPKTGEPTRLAQGRRDGAGAACYSRQIFCRETFGCDGGRFRVLPIN